jgi:UDP-N-acetylmuramate dehydrogenase
MQTNNEIFIGSGYFLAKLASESVKNNLTGLEWAAGIPGTVGGAVCNNAGSFGKCMGDIIKEVEVLKIEKGLLMADPSKAEKSGNREAKKRKLEIIKLYKKQCQFSYRNSMYVILSAVLKLEKGNGAKSRGVIFRYLKSRVEKQPLKYPSAGSVFINPILNDNQIEKLIKRNSELNNICKNNVIPVGWFVEKLQLKGKKIGGAIISEKHGNFIVNTDNAKAEDVVILISIIKQKVRSKFEVQLKEEIEYVGF